MFIPKCPKCNKEIDTILITQKVMKLVEMDGDGHKSDYDLESIDEPEYKCPNCKETLFKKWRAAIGFLNPIY